MLFKLIAAHETFDTVSLLSSGNSVRLQRSKVLDPDATFASGSPQWMTQSMGVLGMRLGVIAETVRNCFGITRGDFFNIARTTLNLTEEDSSDKKTDPDALIADMRIFFKQGFPFNEAVILICSQYDLGVVSERVAQIRLEWKRIIFEEIDSTMRNRYLAGTLEPEDRLAALFWSAFQPKECIEMDEIRSAVRATAMDLAVYQRRAAEIANLLRLGISEREIATHYHIEGISIDELIHVAGGIDLSTLPAHPRPHSASLRRSHASTIAVSPPFCDDLRRVVMLAHEIRSRGQADRVGLIPLPDIYVEVRFAKQFRNNPTKALPEPTSSRGASDRGDSIVKSDSLAGSASPKFRTLARSSNGADRPIVRVSLKGMPSLTPKIIDLSHTMSPPSAATSADKPHQKNLGTVFDKLSTLSLERRSSDECDSVQSDPVQGALHVPAHRISHSDTLPLVGPEFSPPAPVPLAVDDPEQTTVLEGGALDGSEIAEEVTSQASFDLPMRASDLVDPSLSIHLGSSPSRVRPRTIGDLFNVLLPDSCSPSYSQLHQDQHRRRSAGRGGSYLDTFKRSSGNGKTSGAIGWQ